MGIPMVVWWHLYIDSLRPGDTSIECVGKLTVTGSDNSLSPGRHQAIIWTNFGILLIGPLETNFSEILIGIQSFSLILSQPQCVEAAHRWPSELGQHWFMYNHVQCQAVTWADVDLLLNDHSGTKFNEIWWWTNAILLSVGHLRTNKAFSFWTKVETFWVKFH